MKIWDTKHCLPSKAPFASPKEWTTNLFGYYGEISVFISPYPLSAVETYCNAKNSADANFKAYLGAGETSPLPFHPVGRPGNMKQTQNLALEMAPQSLIPPSTVTAHSHLQSVSSPPDFPPAVTEKCPVLQVVGMINLA